MTAAMAAEVIGALRAQYEFQKANVNPAKKLGATPTNQLPRDPDRAAHVRAVLIEKSQTAKVRRAMSRRKRSLRGRAIGMLN